MAIRVVVPHSADAKETVYLNRVIRHVTTFEGPQIGSEPDQRRVDSVLRSLNLRGAQSDAITVSQCVWRPHILLSQTEPNWQKQHHQQRSQETVKLPATSTWWDHVQTAVIFT